MLIIHTVKKLISSISKIKTEKNKIGFVPTMGALHDGHLVLVNKAIKENQITIVSIFVNPLQFNNSDDLKKYPQNIGNDIALLEKYNVDIVFNPTEKEFYPSKPLISIDFGSLSRTLEGKFRKGHFGGVGIVISKLLHLIQPTIIYLGLKDLQQYLLIKQMCIDLNFPCIVSGVETVRKKSGLALSSRNEGLSVKGLEIAPIIYQGLQQIEEGIRKKKNLHSLIENTKKLYLQEAGFTLEYLEAVSIPSLSPIDNYTNINALAVCVAGYVERIRLIDNIYLQLK